MRLFSIILFFFPLALFGQSIQFSHNYRIFGIEENDTDTFQLRLSSIPSGDVTVTLSASNDEGLLSFSPSQLTFTTGNYNSYQDVYITADSTPSIDAVRTAIVTASASGGGYSGVTLNKNCYLRERMGDFIIWMIGDPHLGTDLAKSGSPYNGVQEAIQDFRDGQDSVQRLVWDIGICVGDITGQNFDHISGELSSEIDGPYAGFGVGYVWREVWGDNGIDIHNIYSVAGNHDGGDTLLNTQNKDWIDQYLDPWGEVPSLSGITNANRPYPVTKLRTDIGFFDVGSIRFVLIHDRNDAKWPAGKNDVSKGHPAGTYTRQAMNVFDSLLENSPQQTVIGIAHHLLEATTTYTAFGEEEEVTNTAFGIHGNHGLLDSLRGSYVSIVWDEEADYNTASTYRTYDGVDLNGSSITPFQESFKTSLDNTFDHHYWFAGHTHPGCTAYDEYNGRAMVVNYTKKYGVMNCGTLAKFHGDNKHQYSRIVHLYEGSKKFRIQTFTHVSTTVSNDGTVADQNQRNRVIWKGINDDLEYVLPLNTCFDSSFDSTNQGLRGNCPTCTN